jgi:ankyrin repeat protein
MHGKWQSISFVLTRTTNVDVNERDEWGRTPLQCVVSNLLQRVGSVRDNWRCLDLLLNAGAAVDATDRIGWSSLTEACYAGDAKIVWKLMSSVSKRPVATARTRRRNTSRAPRRRVPLCVAAEFGHDDVMSVLVAHGEDVDEADAGGNTPLHYVISRALTDTDARCRSGPAANVMRMLDCLLLQRANVNVANSRGLTPLYMAVKNRLPNIYRVLLNTGRSEPNLGSGRLFPLCAAAENDDADAVELLLAAGARTRSGVGPASIQPPWVRLPLCIASLHCNPAIVRLLLDHGAGANVADDTTFSPLHNTIQFVFQSALCNVCDDGVFQRAKSCVRLLLDHGADPDRPKCLGRTPTGVIVLHLFFARRMLAAVHRDAYPAIAFRSALLETFRQLVDHGATVDDSAVLGCYASPARVANFVVRTDAKSREFLLWLVRSAAADRARFRLISAFCEALDDRHSTAVASTTRFSADVCKAAVLAGYRILASDIDDVRRLDDADLSPVARDDVVEWLDFQRRHPQSLMSQCRAAVARSMAAAARCRRRGVDSLIDRLTQIPNAMRLYLKYDGSWNEFSSG